MHFSGTTYDASQDHERLQTALDRVFHLMSDGRWRTLATIALEARTSEAGASARLRDFRKPDIQQLYPVRRVNTRRVQGGIWEYQVEVETVKSGPGPTKQPLLFDVSKDGARL